MPTTMGLWLIELCSCIYLTQEKNAILNMTHLHIICQVYNNASCDIKKKKFQFGLIFIVCQGELY